MEKAFKILLVLATLASAATLCAQDNVFHGDVDLDETEEYMVYVYAWEQIKSDSVPGRLLLIHREQCRGQYAFDLKYHTRFILLVFVDVKERHKYCYVVEPGTDKGRFQNDVNFSKKTSRLYWKTDVKSSTMLSRDIRIE